MTTSDTDLPFPPTDAYVELSLLDGGSFTASTAKLHAGVEDTAFRLYDWSFYIHEPKSGRHVLWDVGISSERDDYTPWVQKFMLDDTQAVGPRVPLAKQVEQRGVKPEDVDTVIFSHAHWDHARPISHVFSNALGYFGPGTAAHCTPGHLTGGLVQWDGRFFDPSPTHRTERWTTLPGPWIPLGSFPRAMDFFGNGAHELDGGYTCGEGDDWKVEGVGEAGGASGARA